MTNMSDDTNSKIIRFSLRLWGKDLLPQQVTSALGFKPSYSYEKGYTKKLSSGKVSAAKDLGIWVYEQVVESSFESELESLLKKIEGKNLKEIEGVEIVILDLYFGLSDSDSLLSESCEFRIDSGILSQLVNLGLDLRFTVS